MDTLTHALSGALLARATAGDRAARTGLPLKWRVTAGLLAAAFPDSDIVITAFSQDYLVLHRGVTHSLILLPLWATLLSFAFMALTRGRYSWRAFLGISALGLLAHIAGDVITSFGTMVFAPLSDRRLAWPTTFIIDLYFSGILLAGSIASLIWRKRRVPAIAALVLLGVYIGLQVFARERALDLGERYAQTHELDRATVRAFPQPLSPFNWMIVVSAGDDYWYAYVNLYRDLPAAAAAPDAGFLARLAADYAPPQTAQWHTLARFGEPGYAQVIAREAWHEPAFRRYRDFSLAPALYRVDKEHGTCVWFYDLRFALPERRAPFLYGMCQDDPRAAWHVSRLRP